MILMIVKREASLRVLRPLIGRLPARYAEGVNRLISHFIDGFRIMVDPALLISVTGLSLLIWLIDVGAIYLLFLAVGFQLPVVAAFVVMIILISGSHPGPGILELALPVLVDLFNPQTDALTFAIIYILGFYHSRDQLSPSPFSHRRSLRQSRHNGFAKGPQARRAPRSEAYFDYTKPAPAKAGEETAQHRPPYSDRHSGIS
jgi:hypothetical protein